ncbi:MULTISPECIES: helix-turn-helix transcriptional regulator [unclassified Gordonia (in: high G+C Gram-positive bacteria)]|uniref:ArsR/SmtB family transcription factor n=1 Tax=unclassified Gordonia (in: high G+C Gram-positive bacteria) TaxID=2657482 RepID=UPI001F0CEE63|nr:metalloregulator ArsR/SmtB family transcription factor [Gordonia sp. ABSL49_1]MCH5644330.1 metalloregulator ArsR/SmtB family transcription factor [Gordonia sp. ABSL49_1]
MDGADHSYAHADAADRPHEVDVTEWTRRFDLLSDPHRLEILIVLHRQPGIFVGDIATAVGRTETAVSQALRVLRHQGWVTSTRVGRSVSYRLDDETVHELLHWMGAGHE